MSIRGCAMAAFLSTYRVLPVYSLPPTEALRIDAIKKNSPVGHVDLRVNEHPYEGRIFGRALRLSSLVTLYAH